MAIVKEITTSGQNTVSTLSGSIRLEEGRGRLVVYDSISNIELTTLDRTGFLFSDGTDRRIKLGSYASEVVFAISKTGEDVLDLLSD